MLAYNNTEVVDAETSPLYPDFGPQLALCRKALANGGLNYVTKRTYGWFEEQGIANLLSSVNLYGTGVIHVLRDPRAVLKSRHRRSSRPTEPYVDEKRWYESMVAVETIWRELADYDRKCQVRYEDLIRDPDAVNQLLCDTFRLTKSAGIGSINQAKTNAFARGYVVSEAQSAAMHGLRDADVNALNKDLDEIELESEPARQQYRHVLRTHYESDDQ